MAAPTGIVLIAGAAFAAGIAGAVAVGAFRSGPPPATASAPKTERTWSDPVKAQAAKAASDAAPRLRLSFRPEGATAGDRTFRVDAPTPLPPTRPSALYAAAPAQSETVGEAEAPTGPIRPRPARERIADMPRSEIRTSSNAVRDRLAERRTRDPHLSSADAGGVMQWLSAPGRY